MTTRMQWRRARTHQNAQISRARCLLPSWAREIEFAGIGLTVCYFLAIGAVADSWRLTAMLEEQLELDVDATAEQPGVVAAFPSEDLVRLVTHRGCSCSLVRPLSRALVGHEVSSSLVSLTLGCRRAIARAVNALGAVRLYVRARKHPSAEPLSRVAMTLDEFLRAEAAVPANALVEIVARISPESLN